MCPLVKVLCHFVLHTPALFEVLRPTGDAVTVLPTHHAMRCHGHAWSLARHVTVTVSYIVQNYVLQSCFTHFLLKTPARVAPTATTIIYAMYVQYIVRHVFSVFTIVLDVPVTATEHRAICAKSHGPAVLFFL